MTRSPRRWSGSELPEALSAALASADVDASEQAIARVRARLSAALGPAFAEVPPPTAAAQAGPFARTLRLLPPGKWFGIGALFAVGFGALWITGPGAPAGPAEQGHGASPAAGVRTGTGAVHGPSPQMSATAAEVVPPAPVELDPALLAADGVAPVLDLPPSAAEPVSPPRTAGRAKRAQAKPAELGLAEELRQLELIRQRLRGSPAQALSEADAHARRFPHGTLGPERELLRVDALLRLGREAEARRLGARMLAAPEGHPYRAQLEKLLDRPYR